MEDWRMQRSGVGADASAFFLFEATGDSEVDGSEGPGPAEEVSMGEDDAASCSCDSSDWTDADGVGVGGCDVEAWLGDGREENEDDELEDEQNSGAQQLPGAEYKSCVSVESTSELMNEMERSKLFWEACLAS